MISLTKKHASSFYSFETTFFNSFRTLLLKGDVVEKQRLYHLGVCLKCRFHICKFTYTVIYLQPPKQYLRLFSQLFEDAEQLKKESVLPNMLDPSSGWKKNCSVFCFSLSYCIQVSCQSFFFLISVLFVTLLFKMAPKLKCCLVFQSTEKLWWTLWRKHRC